MVARLPNLQKIRGGSAGWEGVSAPAGMAAATARHIGGSATGYG